MADVTPDPADEAAVKDVADAIATAFRVDVGVLNWTAEARAAIAAYLPHLTAERDAARNEYVATGATLDHVTDRLSDMVDDAGLARPESLADTLDAISTLITERDAETTALRAELEEAESRLAQIWGLVQKTAGRGDDLPADANEQVLDLTDWNSATPPAVLADPAPSTDLSGFTITAAPPSVAAVMDLVSRSALGYLAASQEWTDNHGDPLPDDQQDGADYLQRAGLLHEFDEWFPTKPAPSTPAAQETPDA